MDNPNNQQNIDIATMKTDIDYIKKSIDGLIKAIEIHINQCETRYAAKWAEKAMTAIIGLIVLGVFGALLTLVLR